MKIDAHVHVFSPDVVADRDWYLDQDRDQDWDRNRDPNRDRHWDRGREKSKNLGVLARFAEQ